ncbi:hypothetical protein MGYG_07868 [Nannizzia gypsea CBS 118893]|uniref:Hypervirulence associated protein TUDOR domain-containing protein n=1 Tax=Arthroderma gypseum (strain ATCC MYA-4604 / CBS 118893) TaxID=535722 RepID=E4V4E1_ARTGP|nr:hypothetical protein MGYG_07868 [Nannizzia gypsea CBS 118893]EFR04865.1 hypothetical protein MGYG_07868 [Nannizzia gypsea CBS 118893]
MPQYKEGQNVRYKPVGGPDSNTPESTGCIMSVLTEPGTQAGRNVDASESRPRYEIENQNTGKTTTIYEENILGTV